MTLEVSRIPQRILGILARDNQGEGKGDRPGQEMLLGKLKGVGVGVLGRRTIVPVAGRKHLALGKVGAGERRGLRGPRGCPYAFLCSFWLAALF